MDEMNELRHVGVGHLDGGNSGRYPWGSGEDPKQDYTDFDKRCQEYRDAGMSDTEISRLLGMSTTEFRKRDAIIKAEKKALRDDKIFKLKDKGYSNTEIGRLMGLNESTIRSVISTKDTAVRLKTNSTVEALKKEMDGGYYLDVTSGSERYLGITRNRLNTAVQKMEDEGYKRIYRQIPQVNNPKLKTTMVLLCPPGTTYKDVSQNLDKVKYPGGVCYSKDDGESYNVWEFPKSVDSKRIYVRYKEDGGDKYDGTIFLRRGVPDLSLGNSHYAQVRIAVDGTHYMKGMALYSDDIPDGYDCVYNSNKKKGSDKDTVFKKLKTVSKDSDEIDRDNPFGASLKQKNAAGQYHYIDKDGKEQLGCINKLREEGDWDEYSKKLSAQFLSKQPMKLINRQLEVTLAQREAEYEEINQLTNPVIKKSLLEAFADDCDSASVHLKVAALPRQSSRVLLPVPELSSKEVYAPGYRDGEMVALIRYPHAGTFEIPLLKVNNKHSVAKSMIGETKDAVGINSEVAEQLSGADFDGDHVIVIPTGSNGVKIETKPYLDALKGFNTKDYKYTQEQLDAGAQILEGTLKQTEMGKVSNLITDMTLIGAPPDELARAVKHSMVVIDAEKHKLDYQRSFKENRINELKEKYQGAANAGAGTIISRAKGKYILPYELKEGGYVKDPETGDYIISTKTGKAKVFMYSPFTGEKLYRETGRTYAKYTERIPKEFTDENGNKKVRYERVVHNAYQDKESGKWFYYSDTKDKDGVREKIFVDDADVKVKDATMELTKMDAAFIKGGNAEDIMSQARYPQEEAYAKYANHLRALANRARLDMLETPNLIYSPAANKEYDAEVKSLKAKLNTAGMNSPRERMAQLLANQIVDAKRAANPNMSKEDLKKERNRALASSRARTGASKELINITDKEWEAIQSGAISQNLLAQIVANADQDIIRQLATPRKDIVLSEGKQRRIYSMLSKGISISEIADAVGVSTSVVKKYMDAEGGVK